MVRAFTAVSRVNLQLAHHLDGTVRGLRDGRRLPRQYGPRGDLRVEGVGLAGGASRAPVAPIHCYNPMPRAAHRPCQAGAIAAGAVDAERVNPPVGLGPRDQRLVAARINNERVIAETDPPAVDRHRDVDVRMRINADDHRPPHQAAWVCGWSQVYLLRLRPELARVGRTGL